MSGIGTLTYTHAHQALPCLVAATQTACAALSILSGPVLSQTYCWRSLTLIIVTLGRLHPCPPCKRRQTHLDLLYESLKTQEWHFTNFNGITSLIFQHWQKKKCLDYNTLPSSQTERWRERGFGALFFRCSIVQLLFSSVVFCWCEKKKNLLQCTFENESSNIKLQTRLSSWIFQ